MTNPKIEIIGTPKRKDDSPCAFIVYSCMKKNPDQINIYSANQDGLTCGRRGDNFIMQHIDVLYAYGDTFAEAYSELTKYWKQLTKQQQIQKLILAGIDVNSPSAHIFEDNIISGR
jgi:hypothetical protein